MIFLAQKFVLSIIICIFTTTEFAKPLNDAQMCGSFLRQLPPRFKHVLLNCGSVFAVIYC